MGKQDLSNSFYNIDNLVTIEVTMSSSDWEALKNAEPKGGRCNTKYIGDRFDWYKAQKVTISGTRFPKRTSFSDVGIVKKSYCGSFSTSKPSVRLDFTKYAASNEAVVEGLIGNKILTLNNSIQDHSYIRQTLGYQLFRQADLPYLRCNYTKLIVNGTDMGVYINIESMKKPFLKNCFHGNDKGNAYEMEIGEDITVEDCDRISFEGFSNFKDKKDLKLAAQLISSGGVAGVKQIIDYDQFIRFYAMECLLKHWDGYAGNRNNVYLYNDTVAVANPTAANVKFKFIPWGIDQILQDGRDFTMSGSGHVADLVRQSNTEKTTKLFPAVQRYADTIFTKENYDKTTEPLISRMEIVLANAGVDAKSSIATVREQLKLVRTGAYQLIGAVPTGPVTIQSYSDGTSMRASNSEFATGAFPAGDQEVYHGPPSGELQELWTVARRKPDSPTVTIRNNLYKTWLRCNNNVKAASGALNAYAARTDPDPGNDFTMFMTGVHSPSSTHFSGMYTVQSNATKKYLYFSMNDKTPKGRTDVIQTSNEKQASAVFLH